MNKVFLYFLFLLIFFRNGYSQLVANAGPDIKACYNTSVTIGGTPSANGGNPPYKYLWQPSTFLNSTTVSNPIASGLSADITYTLTVTDFDTTIVSNTMIITIDKIYTFSAGIDTGYCFGQTGGVKIGASNNNNTFHDFNWSPPNGLDNSNSTNPLATPSVTTIYTLTVSDGSCPDNISQVTVTAFQPPITDAGPDTTIYEGQTITLNGIGGTIFWWQPDYRIKYISTANPDVYPITTTTYTLWTQDQHGCSNSDTVRITVLPSNQLVFYSAFTPNADGENDFFYIGNLEKYPDNNLKIYNRYGKVIYSVTNYDNTWNGTYLGNIVPTGTYFYILNDGKDQLHKGSVTILR